ncbi:putative NT-type C2 domain-containing protein [Helianthus annuus]|nr:putative NT-type C2 domain-containing protein [Helianthus annuus]
MFKAQRNGKSPSSGEKIDFKFSNFQALQVPKVWDKLSVSIISVESGKTIARTNKALVRNGNCQWTETLSESIWIQHNNSSKELEEHLFKFVVSMGSARCGILGEAMVNMARYYTSSKSSSPVSLPLKKCNYGTILQVKIQCLTPRTKLRYMFVDEDNDHASSSRSNGSAVSLNPKSKSPPTQDLAPTSLLEQIKIMEPSYEPSSSNQNNDSAEHSLEKKTFHQESHINGIKHNIDANSKNSVSKSNKSSLKSMITQDDQEQEYNESSAHVPPSSSVINVGSSKNLLEAAEETIEELRDEARTWEEKTQKLMLGLEILREKYSDQSKTLAESQIEISSAMAERDSIKKEADHIKMLLEESVVKQKAPMESKSTYNSKGQSQRLKELENELKAHKESNIDLTQQLKKSQESNFELVSILQELEETTETQRTEIEELRAVKSTLTELEKSFNSNLMETRSLQLKLQLARVKDELEKSESEKQKLQESAENLIEECNTLQKSYEDMTKGNAELYDQYSCLVIELTSETERNQKEVERLKHEISRLDEQKSTLTLEKLSLESSLKENDIHTFRKESERKIQELTTELAVVKKHHKKLIAEHEKKSKLLTSYRIREERIRTDSEHERQQLIEEAANLKEKVSDYKQKLEKLKNEKSNLEASLHSVSNSFEKLKAEKMSFFNKMSEFEDCKSERDALEEKLSRLEGDLTAKNASRLQDANIKNEISRIKSANLQYRLKIQQLEGEKKELLKKVDDLTGVHETRTQEDTDYAAKMKMLEAELDEALNANHKYRVQLQKQKSKGRNTHSSGKSKAEGEVVTKELFEKTKSSLETELKDLRDRYLEMSLKYAQVEAERGDLVMQLKTNSAKK